MASKHRRIRAFMGLASIALLAACGAPEAPVSTPIAQVWQLATAVISPTPNADDLRATARAISPTPAPPTSTPIPSPTAYVGLFIGRAEADGGFVPARTPFFASDTQFVLGDASRCSVPLDTNFVALWEREASLREALNCPIQAGFGWTGNTQIYAGGVMYSNPSTRTVWAISPQTRRFWNIDAPTPADASALLGLGAPLIPVGDFGNLWAGNAELRSALGNPQTEEQAINLATQRMEGGAFLLDQSAGQIYALAVDGRLLGIYPLPNLSMPSLDSTPLPTDAP